jgi:hypothetical protein
MSKNQFWFNQSEVFWNTELDPKFAEVLIRHGLGHSFNLIEDHRLLHLNETSDDFRYDYHDEVAVLKRPWKLGNQLKNRLMIGFYFFEFSTWHSATCHASSFSVHSPYELPISSKVVKFTYDKEIDVWITPEIIKTDEDLRSIPPEERNCYFEGERELTYFKIYTQKNCEMECLSFVGKFFEFY